MGDYDDGTNKKVKRTKIDWNGVIIKELRKVFKKHHMKPLKIMSNNGKEENAPWRKWFDEACKRGVHTELPEDILTKAVARYPLQGPYPREHQFDANPPPDGYLNLLDPSQQVPSPSTLTQSASVRRDMGNFFPPTFPLGVYNTNPSQPAPVTQHSHVLPSQVYPQSHPQSHPQSYSQQQLPHYPEHFNSQVPSPSSDPALPSPQYLTPEQSVPSNRSPVECTEPNSPTPNPSPMPHPPTAPDFKGTDAMFHYFNSNPPLIPLPGGLDNLPQEQRLSNPALLSSHSFSPATSARAAALQRQVTSSSSHSWPDINMEYGQSNEFLANELANTVLHSRSFQANQLVTAKEEIAQQDLAHSKRSSELPHNLGISPPKASNGPSLSHNGPSPANGNTGPNPSNGSSYSHQTKTENQMVPEVNANLVQANYIRAEVVEASDIHTDNMYPSRPSAFFS